MIFERKINFYSIEIPNSVCAIKISHQVLLSHFKFIFYSKRFYTLALYHVISASFFPNPSSLSIHNELCTGAEATKFPNCQPVVVLLKIIKILRTCANGTAVENHAPDLQLFLELVHFISFSSSFEYFPTPISHFVHKFSQLMMQFISTILDLIATTLVHL